MTPADAERIEPFIIRWQTSSGNERANYQMFFAELCDALGVVRPDAKGSIPTDPYCFDKDLKIYHPSGKVTPGYIDFYKADHFLIEAKQGGDITGKGTAKRGTNSYLKAMEGAFVQAIAYTRNLSSKPPFVLTCDIGDHFELWAGFNGDYGGYGARQDILLTGLRKPEIFGLFVDIFTDPQKRNPEKIAAKVTREVAADLAELSKRLERSPHPQPFSLGEKGADLVPLLPGEKGVGDEGRPQEVAHFLMCCIFTMFAEDVGLLKEQLFTEALEGRWLLNPKSFKPEVEALWQAMNDGTTFGFYGRLLKFNGGLFTEAIAFDLTADQLVVLLTAAKRDWKNVEPAIFGTLLERALDSKERSKLGAHYTPRSYVERLVRPVVMEPLREQWDLVQGEVLQTLGDVGTEPNAAQKKKAIASLEGFLLELRSLRVLDPACGSGNFLYVTLDLMKQLESEVLRRLEDVTGQAQLRLDIDQVNPGQFLGIELNPRAAAIADLVIWIGYLQWHFKRFGDIPPVEPVLREYKNIECRDAVLAYDGKVEDVDAKTGKVRTRWGGRMMKHSVTGEMVPDPSDQMPIYRYINARSAEWMPSPLAPLPRGEGDMRLDRLPSALGRRVGDEGEIYIVSNPPFIGNARMRDRLGDGYTETLRQVYPDVPETVDYVMYWWHKAAELVRSRQIQRFGFITTNSIHQVRQRKVIEFHQNQKNPLRLTFAIADHPWVEEEGAAVRIAMTVGQADSSNIVRVAQIGTVIQEVDADTPEESSEKVDIEWSNVGKINSNLTAGIDVTSIISLKAQSSVCGTGVKVYGSGFILEENEYQRFSLLDKKIICSYKNGRDITQKDRNLYVIDCFGLTEENLQQNYPQAYQWLLEKVYPYRSVERDQNIKNKWWLFERNRPELRKAIHDISRYIVSVETSKHRVFSFLSSSVLPDVKLTVITLDDAYFLGILSSKIHSIWALATGSKLEDRPVYVKTRCFDPFPFPTPTPDRQQKIRELGDRLDTHRKRIQSQHPDVTITAMYNLLEKIRAGIELTEGDRAFNNKALVSTLKQIHDELDAAVFEAYGWGDLIGGVRGFLPSSPALLPRGEGSKKDGLVPGSVPLLPGEKGLGDEGLSKVAGKARQLPKALIQRAQELRQNQTSAEQILWECLRDRRICDTKFRRQHNIGQFIADFYCHAAKLVIELDGGIHNMQIERDRDRDEWMQAHQLIVLRFKNEQILDDLETVLTEIVNHLQPSSLALLPRGEGSKKDGLVPGSVPLLPREKGLGDEGQPQNVDELILERLVALNAQRAEEERNGLIRWLRPDYQAPGELQTQQIIEGITEIEIEAIAPVEQQKFPKAFKDQLAAIRDLLRTQGGEWAIDQIAAQFKSATRQKQAILTCLESLEALGIVTHHREESGDRWYFAELQKNVPIRPPNPPELGGFERLASSPEWGNLGG